jgi:hypothetical protein
MTLLAASRIAVAVRMSQIFKRFGKLNLQPVYVEYFSVSCNGH